MYNKLDSINLLYNQLYFTIKLNDGKHFCWQEFIYSCCFSAFITFRQHVLMRSCVPAWAQDTTWPPEQLFLHRLLYIRVVRCIFLTASCSWCNWYSGVEVTHLATAESFVFGTSFSFGCVPITVRSFVKWVAWATEAARGSSSPVRCLFHRTLFLIAYTACPWHMAVFYNHFAFCLLPSMAVCCRTCTIARICSQFISELHLHNEISIMQKKETKERRTKSVDGSRGHSHSYIKNASKKKKTIYAILVSSAYVANRSPVAFNGPAVPFYSAKFE